LRLIVALSQHKPIEGVLHGAPNEILFDPVPAVGAEFFVQVNGTAAGGDFDGELRGADEVAFAI